MLRAVNAALCFDQSITMRTLILLSFILICGFANGSPKIMQAQNGNCEQGYILLSDVCVKANLLGDMDGLVDAMLEFKDPNKKTTKRDDCYKISR